MKNIIAFMMLFISITWYSQAKLLTQKLKVYIDCSNGGECYPTFVKQEIPVVDFVRDRLDADVHVVVTTLYNSSGSAQYVLNFIGRNNFSVLHDTIQYTLIPGSIDDVKRNLFVSKLKLGLIPYLTKTSQTDKITITFTKEEHGDTATAQRDPWNYWAFQISANGNMDGNQNYFSGNGYFSISADKETEKIKSNFYISNSEQVEQFNDDGKIYKYHFQDYSIGFEHYKKMNQHYAIGGYINAANSLFSNYKYQARCSVNGEYSIFPYKDFNTKRWIVLYKIGPTFNQYYDSTTYFKIKEFVFEHSLGSIFSYIQPWGSTNIGVFWSNYLNDFKKNNLSLSGALQFKIAKGLNFAVWGNYSFVHDQINIRKGDIDLNQILVKNRELLSNYNYNLGMGISYRFGSKFNNAVNPAFRGMSYNISL